MTGVAVDVVGVVILVGGLLGTAALVALGLYAGRYLDEPTQHGASAASPVHPARVSPARQLLLVLLAAAVLAILVWVVLV